MSIRHAFKIALPILDPNANLIFWDGFVDDVTEQIVIKDHNSVELFRIGGGGTTNYAGASPSTVTVNDIPAGTNISGMSYDDLFQNIYAPFLAPAFSAFAISAQAQLIQVGTTLSGVKLFTWTTTNSANVQPNSIAIRDVTANTLIASGLVNDGAENVNIGVISNLVPITQSWRAEAIDTEAAPFNSSNFTINSIYPIFAGKVASGGAAPGVNRPLPDQALINSGALAVTDSTGTTTVTFNSSADDYIWIAIPVLSALKTTWFVDTLNTGPIGGAVSPAGNLFPAPNTVAIDSPTALWSAINYRIYISNYQTASSSAMQFRN